MAKEKMFTVSIKDCDVQTFRAGGKGGQNQNKTSSGVRVVHRPSGAVGESREERSQLQNKRTAFRRMADTPQFKRWVQREASRITGEEAKIEQAVERQMMPWNLKVEVKNDAGLWVGEGSSDPPTAGV